MKRNHTWMWILSIVLMLTLVTGCRPVTFQWGSGQQPEPEQQVEPAQPETPAANETLPTTEETLPDMPHYDLSNIPPEVASGERGVVARVAAITIDGVVGITTEQVVRGVDWFSQAYSYNVPVSGSGVVVSPDGYIVTNAHVVGTDGQPIQVLFSDGEQLEGEVRWVDSVQDLAVLKVQTNKELPYIYMGDSDKIVIGERAIAIGNPLGLDFQRSVTAGYISGLDRSVTVEKYEISGLIQTDASINKGNSGGPLLNDRGEVIGINSIKVGSAEGLSFSIPINNVKPVVEELIRTGKYEPAQIGISVLDVKIARERYHQDLPTEEGVLIMELAKHSPAQNAGLEPGDIITQIDERPVRHVGELKSALNHYQIGDEATVTYMRGDQEKTVSVKFTAMDR